MMLIPISTKTAIHGECFTIIVTMCLKGVSFLVLSKHRFLRIYILQLGNVMCSLCSVQNSLCIYAYIFQRVHAFLIVSNLTCLNCSQRILSYSLRLLLPPLLLIKNLISYFGCPCCINVQEESKQTYEACQHELWLNIR